MQPQLQHASSGSFTTPVEHFTPVEERIIISNVGSVMRTLVGPLLPGAVAGGIIAVVLGYVR